MSFATCGACGASWNVAGLSGVSTIICQRCGGPIPLGDAFPEVGELAYQAALDQGC